MGHVTLYINVFCTDLIQIVDFHSSNLNHHGGLVLGRAETRREQSGACEENVDFILNEAKSVAGKIRLLLHV